MRNWSSIIHSAQYFIAVAKRFMTRPKPDRSELDGLRILIVEDDWWIGTGLAALLEAWGADVIGPAATSADAVNLVSENSPDVALVDISLRLGERSDSLIDQLHDQGIRVVVISGYPEVLITNGKPVAFLQKPIREEQLLASLRPALQTE